MRYMTSEDQADWQALDPLVLSGAKLQFIVQVQAVRGIGLPEALDLLRRRYEYLRKSRPQDFHCTHEEYWQGFYS